jgi:hypothetical protein
LWPGAGADTRCPTTLHGARPFWASQQNGSARPSIEGDYSFSRAVKRAAKVES